MKEKIQCYSTSSLLHNDVRRLQIDGLAEFIGSPGIFEAEHKTDML